MRAVGISFVHWTMQTPQHVLATSKWHLHVLQQPPAQHNATTDEPLRSRKMTLAFVFVILRPAVLQHDVFLLFFVPYMNVMLLRFLHLLHVMAQVLMQPLLAFLQPRLRRRGRGRLAAARRARAGLGNVCRCLEKSRLLAQQPQRVVRCWLVCRL